MSAARWMWWAMAGASITALVACGSSDSGSGGGGAGGAGGGAGSSGAGGGAGTGGSDDGGAGTGGNAGAAGGDTDGGDDDAASEAGSAQCQEYCGCMDATCPGVLTGDCMTICAGLSADALSCRITHCHNAEQSDPQQHCQHAAGQAICQ